MNATKRKFNSLLQGLSTNRPSNSTEKQPVPAAATPVRPSTTKATDASPTASILEKRRRLEASELQLSASPSRQEQPTVISLSTPKKPVTTVVKTPLRNEAAAKYSPTDRTELLRRLATFQDITDWTPKPDRVNEIEWAKRGWVCQGKERVGCVLCRKELVVKLNRKELNGKEVSVLVASEIESALVDKYEELIIESHQEDCLWRKRGCDDSLLRLSLVNAKSTLEDLRQRYDELCTRKPFLPYEFNLRLPDGLNVDQILEQLPSDFFSNPSAAEGSGDQSPNRVALALAVLGWQGLTNSRIGSVPNSASCHTCQRRLGLWMFKSKEVDENGQVLVPAPMDHLDPVREHRFFCPWKNGLAQSRTGVSSAKDPALPGWQILLQTLKNEAHLRSVLEGPKIKGPRGIRGHNAAFSLPAIPTQRLESLNNPNDAGAQNDGENQPASTDIHGGDAVEDDKEREAKDKARWARLRRVKSLFETKNGKKLRRATSRPGTSHSTAGQPTESSG